MEVEKVEKKYYKLRICNFYEKYGKCNNGKNCNYAHGEDELREFKKDCVNGLNCFKKKCHFSHPKGWNYKNNVKICEYYMNGFCKKEDNCEFRHIEENNNKNNNSDIEEDIEIYKEDRKIDINNNNEFPYLKENKRNIKDDCSLENINNINIDDDLCPNVEFFVDGIKYDNLNILDVNDKVIEDNKNNLNELNKTTNISENMETCEYNLELSVENEDDVDDILNINENTKVGENGETQDLIIKLQESFEEYVKEIKNSIDEIFIEDKYILGINMKLELNKIISEINLFRNNYQDIINKNHNDP